MNTGDNNVNISTEENRILYVSYLNGINAQNVTPNWSGTQEFTVNNTSNYSIAFNIKFKNVYNEFNPASEFVYSLLQDGILKIAETASPTSDGYLLQNIIIPPHTTYRYKLTYRFVDTGENQDYQQGKRFTADLEVELN